MKLSALKELIARVEADTQRYNNPDPDVSFWPTSSTWEKVRQRSGAFVDMEPEDVGQEGISCHRITGQGASYGDYALPLVLLAPRLS